MREGERASLKLVGFSAAQRQAGHGGGSEVRHYGGEPKLLYPPKQAPIETPTYHLTISRPLDQLESSINKAMVAN